MKNLALTAAILAGLIATQAQAQAQPTRNCAPRATVLERLASEYGETRQSIGLARNSVVETFASNETGTWTITVTTPNGLTCLIASGAAFENMAEAPDGDPA